MFGYVFREMVVADRRLQFGWRSSSGVFLFVFRSSRTRSSPHVVRRRHGDGAGTYRDGACLGHPTESNRSADFVATWLSGPPRSGGVEEDPLFRTVLRRRRDIGGGTMAARWPALSTRVRVSRVGPLSGLLGEILTGSHSVGSTYDLAVGYPVLRAWVGHRHRRKDHFRSSWKARAAPRHAKMSGPRTA